jgi:ureidoglycolate lyase
VSGGEAATITARQLPVERLGADAFAPFGVVLEAGTADAEHLNRAPGHLGFLWVHRRLEFPSAPSICTLRYYYRGTRCEFLQKHPSSTVVLVPMGMRPSVVYVAPDDGEGRPRLDEARAFLLDGSRGLTMHPGVWLRYAYPLGPFVDFVYVTQRLDPRTANSSDDVVRVNLDREYGLVLEAVFAAPLGPGVELGPSGAVASLPPQSPPHA